MCEFNRTDHILPTRTVRPLCTPSGSSLQCDWDEPLRTWLVASSQRRDTEARNYDYASNRCHGVCGYYTQIVWRDTREVGCGVARGPGREVWVCDYSPPGNWVGRRPY